MESDAGMNGSTGDAPVHPTINTDTQAAAHTKTLETALKANLRMIDALVGKRVDLQNSKQKGVGVDNVLTGEKKNAPYRLTRLLVVPIVESELEQRLESLATVRHPSDSVDPQEAFADATKATEENTLHRETSGASSNVRTKFVLESVTLLTELENCLLALVKDRGKALDKKVIALQQLSPAPAADVP